MRLGKARLCKAEYDLVRNFCFGWAGYCLLRHGRVRFGFCATVWSGRAWCGRAWCGKARLLRYGTKLKGW